MKSLRIVSFVIVAFFIDSAGAMEAPFGGEKASASRMSPTTRQNISRR